jgi:signal transduction histidine kinase
VIIPTTEAGRPFGVFGVYSRTVRAFTEDDVRFLQSVANVVATAIARRKAEERLWAVERSAEAERLRVAQAEQALRERDEFLSVAAHELRTPLTAMRLQLQGLQLSLERGEMSPANVTLRVRRALRHTDRMGTLVERLLDVSQISAGWLTLHLERLDLVQVVRQVVEELADQARDMGSELRLVVRAHPAGEWDRLRLEQVVMNLLTNALKYGAGKPVDVSVDLVDGRARLVVRDQGIGISEEDAKRIFNRFERAAPRTHFAGMGLGLYIARHIVEAHAGTISVQSAPGAGATFQVDLPVQPP